MWRPSSKAKNDKVDKKFKTYFYPDPGDPTSQYITYKGKVKSLGTVKIHDVYCIGFTPSDCANGSGSIPVPRDRPSPEADLIAKPKTSNLKKRGPAAAGLP